MNSKSGWRRNAKPGLVIEKTSWEKKKEEKKIREEDIEEEERITKVVAIIEKNKNDWDCGYCSGEEECEDIDEERKKNKKTKRK